MAVDRQDRERSRAALYAPRIPDRPFVYEPLHFDCTFMNVRANVLAKHRHVFFMATHAKSISSARHSLLAHMEDLATGTLQLILASKPVLFIPSTANAACNHLLSLRVAFSNATTTPHAPKHLQPRHGPYTDRRGRPPAKCGCRSPDARARRNSDGGGSPLRCTSS